MKVKQKRHVPLILQSGPQDNAAAALAMILSFYGRNTGTWDLAGEKLDNAADVLAAARARGLYAEGYRMNVQELEKAPFPLIAHWKFHSFVVVTGVRGGRVHLLSPSQGRQSMRLRDFESGFTGVALCFAGMSEQKDKAPAPRRGLAAWLPSAGALLVICQLFFSVCCVAAAMCMRSLADRLLSPSGGGTGLALLPGLLALLQLAAMGLELWILRRCEKDLSGRAAGVLAEALDEKSPLLMARMHRAQLAAVCSGCERIPSALAVSAFCALQLLAAVFCLAAIAVQEPFAAAAAAVVTAAFALYLYSQRETLYSEEKRGVYGRFDTEICASDALGGREQMRLSGQSRSRFERWLDRAAGQTRRPGAERACRAWTAFAAAEVFAVFCVCLFRTLAGAIGLPDLAACLWLAVMIAILAGALPGLFRSRMSLRGAEEDLGAFFRTDSLPEKTDELPPDPASLTVQNASWPPEEPGFAAYQGVTMEVRRGEVLAVGMDGGSDPVSLARVFAGVRQPVQGGVYLGNANAADLNEKALYAGVRLMGRGLPFPRGTVRENIAAGCGDITDYAVVQAATDALLHDSILRRAQGYDTPAASLSAGEKILLEFACAFARGTPFLVSAGATDVLDGVTERKLVDALRRRGTGAVFLNAQPELMRCSDAVCRIENGRVVLRERAEFVDWEVSGLARQA